MGRQLQFDRGEALQKALDLFWRQGFSGTSMRDLELGLDMRPGSIYREFGSKQQLYIDALTLYAKETIRTLEEKITESGNLVGGLQGFLESVLMLKKNRNYPCRVCMLSKALSDLDPESQLIKEKAESLNRGFEQNLARLIKQAASKQEIAESTDYSSVARFIQVQIMGLRSLAETGMTRKNLQVTLDDLIETISFKLNTA